MDFALPADRPPQRFFVVDTHYWNPLHCRVPQKLGKVPKNLGKAFAECYTRLALLGLNVYLVLQEELVDMYNLV